jgi:Mn2+/Fe2+ NRAMP family transporter
MIEHLEESTKVENNRKKLSKLIQIMSYLVIWAAVIIIFWLDGNTDAMGYSLVTFYLVLPVSTIIISYFIGKDDGWTNYKWIMLLFFGLMYMLASYATFSLANMLAFEKINKPNFAELLPGIVCSAIGMFIGTIIKNGKKHRNKSL